MAREGSAVLSIGLAVLAMLLAGIRCLGRETEEQLLQKIQSEQNPVRKAKDEVKLGALQLAQAQDAYGQGKVEAGAKRVGVLVDTMKTAWKILQGSGRQAAKQPEGFRELEIALREEERSLEDLARTVSYFDRAPVESAAQELDRMHAEVIQALFPGNPPKKGKGQPAPPAAGNPGSPRQ